MRHAAIVSVLCILAAGVGAPVWAEDPAEWASAIEKEFHPADELGAPANSEFLSARGSGLAARLTKQHDQNTAVVTASASSVTGQGRDLCVGCAVVPSNNRARQVVVVVKDLKIKDVMNIAR